MSDFQPAGDYRTPEVRLQESWKFVKELWAKADPTWFVEIDLLQYRPTQEDPGAQRMRGVLYTVEQTLRDWPQIFEVLSKYNRTQIENIHHGTNPRFQKPKKLGKNTDVSHYVAIWVDEDFKGNEPGIRKHFAETVALLKVQGLEPSVIIESGRGLHGYWLFDIPYEVKDARPICAGIQDFFKLSDTVHDPRRVLRLPGFANLKDPKDPKWCRVLEATWRRYSILDFKDFGIEPSKSGEDKELEELEKNKPKTLSKDPRIEEIKGGVGQGGGPYGGRHNSCVALTGHYAASLGSEESVSSAMQQWNQRNTPPLPEQEISEVVRSIWEKERAKRSEAGEGGKRYRRRSINLLDQPGEKKSKSVELFTAALRLCEELFHTREKRAYAAVKVKDHIEVWPIRSRMFQLWIRQVAFSMDDEKSPSAETVATVVADMEAKALFRGAVREVHTRLAEHEGKIYIDLCNEKWEALEVSSEGWSVINSPPVRFRRAPGMSPLPYPTRGGSVEELRPFINLGSEDDWKLLLSWIVAAFRPKGPFPVLLLHGEQGAAKSTTVKILRLLIDPSTSPLRAEPRDLRDLMIAAANAWVISYDNVSYLDDELSDAVCRLATGGGFSTRQLYTDDEEMIFDAQRPVIINGIEELARRGDLLDRAIPLELPVILDDARQDEREFWVGFGNACPRILGGLLDAVSGALRNLPQTKLTSLPRMADFAKWAAAAEQAFGWPAGATLQAYATNRLAATASGLEASVVGKAVLDLAAAGGWRGTASDLLSILRISVPEDAQRERGWPKTAAKLSGLLRRIAPLLRMSKVKVEFGRERHAGSRFIQIENAFGIAPTLAAEQGALNPGNPIALFSAAKPAETHLETTSAKEGTDDVEVFEL